MIYGIPLLIPHESEQPWWYQTCSSRQHHKLKQFIGGSHLTQISEGGFPK